MTEMNRTTRISLLARMYLLLGKHLPARTGQHIQPKSQLSGIDRSLLAAATDIDRLCSYKLMLHGGASASLFAALGVMDPDRIIAMYCALPSRRREEVMRDPAWAYHVEDQPDDLVQVMADAQCWLKESDRLASSAGSRAADIPISLDIRLKRAERVMLGGLPGSVVNVSRWEMDQIASDECKGKTLLLNLGAIAEGITALADPNDENAQHRVIERVTARRG